MKRIVFAIAFLCGLFSANAQFEVTNTNDSGTGSLREAITNANGSVNETITFNIASAGPWVIQINSNLPNVSSAMIIDGTTQPGWSSSNLIGIQQGSTACNWGLAIQANGCEVYGLEITGFNDAADFGGIYMGLAVTSGQIGAALKGNVLSNNRYGLQIQGDNVVVQGNKFGTDNTGSFANGNTEIGVYIVNGSGNVVGGSGTDEGNLLSGNGWYGVGTFRSDNNVVQGNIIGMDITGLTRIQNGIRGVNIGNTGTFESNGNTVGGANAGEGNLISGNFVDNLRVIKGSNNVIQGNSIGVDSNGDVVSGAFYGIWIGGGNETTDDNIIGGVGAGEGNVIAGHSNIGIWVDPGTGSAIRNTIRGNEIYCNGDLGITLDGAGANNDIIAPTITAFTTGTGTSTVSGTCVSCTTGDFIDVYRDSSSCGDGEGAEYLGTVSFGVDPWSLGGLTLSSSDQLTVMVTDLSGNSSQFNPAGSEIGVYEEVGTGGTEITDEQSGVVDLGSSNIGNDLLFDVTIENTGASTLTISGITSSAAGYTFVSVPSTVDPGSNATFRLQLDGTTAGTYTSTITINNDDSDENPFTFPVTGTIIDPFETYYSTSASVVFDNTAVWNSERDGSGSAPIASDFTNGFASFVIESGNNLSAAVGDVSINNFTIENGGSLRLGSPAFSVNGQTQIDGTLDFGTAANSQVNPVSFLGTLTVGSTGEFERAIGGTQNFYVYFYDDIVNNGLFDLSLHTQWRIAGDLSITNNSSTDLVLAQANSGSGEINADLTITDANGKVGLFGNGTIAVANAVTITNQSRDGLTLQGLSAAGSSTFINDARAIFVYHENDGFPSQNVSFDFTANDNLVEYVSLSDQDVINTDHYNVAFRNGGTNFLIADLKVLGYLQIHSGAALNSGGNTISVEGDWVNDQGSSGFEPAGGEVSFDGFGASDQDVLGQTFFDHLTINNTGSNGEVLFDDQVNVFGTVNLIDGILRVRFGRDFVLESSATVNVTSPAVDKMILLEGRIIKFIDAIGTFNFPIGTDGSYSPTTITLLTGTSLDGVTGTRSVTIQNEAEEEPNVISSNLSLTKYWTMGSSNLSNINATIDFEYNNTEIQGNESNYQPALFDASWTTQGTSAVDDANNMFTYTHTGVAALDGTYTAGEAQAFIPEPELDVYVGSDNTGTLLINGETGVVVDMTSINEGAVKLSLTLAIENSGTQVLAISSIVASDSKFSITSAPTSVGVGATANFFVELDASEAGIYNSTITITSDDLDESPFTFEVTGAVNDEDMVLKDGGAAVSVGSAVDFGQTSQNQALQKTFIIENPSTTNTLIIDDVLIDNSAFRVSSLPSTISPAGAGDLIIDLDASIIGTFSGNVIINSNFATFDFDVTGEVTGNVNETIKVFNLVTPNGDGKHDYLKIEGITEHPGNRVTIFDRWGKKVYQGDDYDNSSVKFEGLDAEGSGSQLNEGTYYYVIVTGSEKTTGFIQISTNQ